MSRTFVISYRVPKLGNGAAAGGLVVALKGYFGMAASGEEHEIVLCGFSNQLARKASTRFRIENYKSHDDPEVVRRYGNVSRWVLDQTEEENKVCYEGYINRVLWPLKHGCMDKIDESFLTNFGDFKAQNERLAEALAPHIQPGDVIRIDDYQLIFLAEELRKAGVEDNKIGFFLHTPLARHEDFDNMGDDLWQGLASQFWRGLRSLGRNADLIGFQSQADASAFLKAFHIDAEVPDRFVPLRTEKVRSQIGVWPASIETEEIISQANEPGTSQAFQKAVKKIPRKAPLIIGVDRRDFTKNIPMRFDVIASLLDNQDFINQMKRLYGSNVPFHFMQVAPETRRDIPVYKEYSDQCDRASKRLARKANSCGFPASEIRTYNKKGIDREDIFDYFQQARVCLVNPLRDGQNLVAKEYLAAQDPEDPGVLVLSRHAGAAEVLGHCAVIIENPEDLEETVIAMKRALTMPLDERKRLYSNAIEILLEQNSTHWAQSYMKALENSGPGLAA